MKRIRNALVSFAIHRSWTTILFILLAVIITGSFFPQVNIDTDPEHMLPENEKSRVFHNQAKKTFSLSEIVVVGVVNSKNPNGIFNPQTLQRIHTLASFAKNLNWEDPDKPGRRQGVIEVDMVAPSMVEHISQAGPGTISFDWLMPKAPQNQEEALAVREKIMANPMLAGRMASEDGKSLCLYLPLTDKHLSYRVYKALNEKIEAMTGDDQFHITGLPVAQDAIGVEMFTEMMVASPLAMCTIFFLLFYFFRKLSLTILPMIIATFSVIIAMGLMIGMDFDVHIMSSMIPVFLMSIAVVDSIHILSEFFDAYTPSKGREETVREVLGTLFMPMLYTSLTSAAGFFSLALTPIPPVQIFGVFVGFGIMVAWFLTIVFVPAYVMVLPKKAFTNFGFEAHTEHKNSIMDALLSATGRTAYRQAKPIIAGLLLLLTISIWGISQIQINDNPIKWFAMDHPIRKADTDLNTHFNGTHPAYLILDSIKTDTRSAKFRQDVSRRFITFAQQISSHAPNAPQLANKLLSELRKESSAGTLDQSFLDSAIAITDRIAEKASDADYYVYDELKSFFSLEQERLKPFKRPDVLQYLAKLQNTLESNGLVGKAYSAADVVSKINQEMLDGSPANYRVPDKLQSVGECYMQFQQGHRPHDLWHMVTPDFGHACVVVQLSSGDNKVMEAVERFVDDYFKTTPPPVPISHKWAGLTYINVAWQNQMVQGMLRSFIGSFGIVLFMTVFLFRSLKWGLLCMVPLTMTIAFIYGFIGIIGKDYDMPVAVLGVLTLGMSVDFAIHFVERCRSIHPHTGSWKKTVPQMFDAPARAISRNIMVIAIGFLPLLTSSLVPYKTTSLLLSSIMLLSGVLTLVGMPAIITLAEKHFFSGKQAIKTAQQ